ncbi:hypothetical protein [Pseudomonas sp. CLCA07]
MQKNKLRFATEDPIAVTSSEFFSVPATASYCYSYDGSLEIKSLEQKTPDLYITKEFNAVLFLQYGASNQSGEILTSSLP